MNSVDPRFFSDAKSWVDQVTIYLEPLGYIPRLERSEDWKMWAIRIQGIPQLSAKQPPDPQGFSDWKQWAMRFNEAIS